MKKELKVLTFFLGFAAQVWLAKVCRRDHVPMRRGGLLWRLYRDTTGIEL